MNLEQLKRVGIDAACQGAEIIRSFYGKLTDIGKKGAIDLVTEADITAEKVIVETILERFPDHGIQAEESGLNRRTSDFRWIIDPLDGTTNFVHQLGFFAVSIAVARSNDIVAGIVLNPLSGELFTATATEPSSLNGRTIGVSHTASVSESLLVTGFPYTLQENLNELLTRFRRCLLTAQGVRRLGSAALDLCYVACGRFDGFWEQGLHPWDTAAGMLICRNAGGVVTNFSGKPFTVDQKEIIASNGNIHQEMIALLNDAN